MFDFKELSIILTTVLSIVSILMVIIFSFQNQRKSIKYNESLKKIELEKMRQEIESKIYELNVKLSEDNIRWNNINHLVYDSQKLNYNNELNNKIYDTEKFINNLGIKEKELEIDPSLVFVLTPFQEIEWNTFVVVREVCNNLSLKCIRGDENHIEGEILPSILKSILQARVVVANINGRNPNVFYELGIAHALGKKTILISKFGEDLPFDVKSKNVILYKENSELQSKLKDALFRAIV